jgi:hypothetical protein
MLVMPGVGGSECATWQSCISRPDEPVRLAMSYSFSKCQYEACSKLSNALSSQRGAMRLFYSAHNASLPAVPNHDSHAASQLCPLVPTVQTTPDAFHTRSCSTAAAAQVALLGGGGRKYEKPAIISFSLLLSESKLHPSASASLAFHLAR